MTPEYFKLKVKLANDICGELNRIAKYVEDFCDDSFRVEADDEYGLVFLVPNNISNNFIGSAQLSAIAKYIPSVDSDGPKVAINSPWGQGIRIDII